MTDQPKEFYKLIVVVSFFFVGAQSLSITENRHSVNQVVDGALGSVSEEVVNIGQELQGLFTEVTTLKPVKHTTLTPITATDLPAPATDVASIFIPEIISHHEDVGVGEDGGSIAVGQLNQEAWVTHKGDKKLVNVKLEYALSYPDPDAIEPENASMEMVQEETEENHAETEIEEELTEVLESETTPPPLQVHSTYTEIPHPPSVPLYTQTAPLPMYTYPLYPIYPSHPTYPSYHTYPTYQAYSIYPYPAYGHYTRKNMAHYPAPARPSYQTIKDQTKTPENKRAAYGQSNPYGYSYPYSGLLPYPYPYPQYPGNAYPVYHPTQGDITAYFPQKG